MKRKSNLGKLDFQIDKVWKAVIVVTMAACIIAAMSTGNAYAGFPDKPLTVIVPYKAGGSTDTMIRVYAKGLAKELGQPVIVQNRPGGGGAVGATHIKNQPPDGHTFLVGAMTIPIWHPLHSQVDYTMDDFTYLGAITEYQMAMISTPDKPFKTLPELIAYSKKKPGLVFADQGSLNKLVFLYIAKQEGVEWRAVPTKGGGGMIPMLLGGQIDFAYSGGVHQRYGDKMTVLASVIPGRLAASPDVPSTSEKYDISIPNLVIVMGPKGIPADRVKILEGALRRATEDKAFVKILTENLKFPKLFKTGEEVKQQLPGVAKQLKNAKAKMGF